MPLQNGHYSNADKQYLIEHQGLVLAEIDDNGFSFTVDPSVEPGGAGLGIQKNSYYKVVGPTKGTFKIARKALQRLDNGNLFLDIVRGSSYIITETIAAASTTYTATAVFISILELRFQVSLNVLREGLDYTVNYVTGAITFPIATPEAITMRMLVANRKLQNYIVNGGFEDAITNTWVAFGTATLVRTNTAANVFAETWGLQVTPAVANDGVKYALGATLQPGRTYRLRCRVKGTAAQTIVATWNDGTTDNVMSPASIAITGATFNLMEFTFTPTKAAVVNFIIKNSAASPSVFYVDEVAVLDDTTANTPNIGNNPMDGGLAVSPITFNVIERRVADGVVTTKLLQCALDKLDFKSGKAYVEDISGMFLNMITE